jgi:hypothetical protein
LQSYYTSLGINFQRDTGSTISQSHLNAYYLSFEEGAYESAMISYDKGVATLFGTWQISKGSSNRFDELTSDRNAKNSIQDVSDAYEVAFDNLQPKIFKFNDGTSNRYHTGFIAQEVDEAIHKAKLTRQDLAAVCIHNEGTEEEYWTLRYNEFVSLNTWQIQKLKKEIKELAAEVGSLKQLIKELKGE